MSFELVKQVAIHMKNVCGEEQTKALIAKYGNGGKLATLEEFPDNWNQFYAEADAAISAVHRAEGAPDGEPRSPEAVAADLMTRMAAAIESGNDEEGRKIVVELGGVVLSSILRMTAALESIDETLKVHR